MWIICDNTKQNLDLLIGLGFKFSEYPIPVGAQPYLDVSTHNKVYLNWHGDTTELHIEGIHEYVPTLPSNFLEQIELLRTIGMSTEEIIGVMKG